MAETVNQIYICAHCWQAYEVEQGKCERCGDVTWLIANVIDWKVKK